MKNVMDLFNLNGKRALITGGSKGLGKVMALALAQAGAEVGLVSRNFAECQAAAREISESTGKKTAAFTADVSQSDDVNQLAANAEKQLGPIDILINNAGINVRGPAEELKEIDWDAIVNINLKAPFLCSRIFGPRMCQRGWGRIINLGSIMSIVALPGRAPYASAKAGVAGLTRVLALEWAAKGVTVNAICPGPFATDMNKQLLNDPPAYKAFVAKLPIGRWGELHEISGAAVFLASDASSFITGTSLYIDGGWTAQ